MHRKTLSTWCGRVALALAVMGVGGSRAAVAQTTAAATAPTPGAAILQDLKRFAEMGTVLYVAAHPDDENTQFITYMARGRGCRTAYLSLTRGDGGQNVIGPEFDAALGVIRTQELLAARRLDGGRQFFTRAIDFGFSKDVQETLATWNKEAVLGDVVRVIRTFRPDVVVARFSPVPSGTHGHHTASAQLTVEAWNLAGDAKAYPEQITEGLKPWQPKRVLQNGRGRSDFSIETGGVDPVLGESYGRIAGRSRGMHKSQGFGSFEVGGAGGGGRGGSGGGAGGGGSRPESFEVLAGEPASDLFDGVDTTWTRVRGGAEVKRGVEEVIARFDPANPAASVPAILELRKVVGSEKLPADPVVAEKRGDLDRILAACLGLSVETTVGNAEVVPGEAVGMRHAVKVELTVPVKWVGVRYPVTKGTAEGAGELKPGAVAVKEGRETLPAGTPLSQPYWLREEGAAGISTVGEPRLIGRPENPPAFPVEFVFKVEGQTVVLPDEPVQKLGEGATYETRRRLEVIPPVALATGAEVEVFTPGARHEVTVEVSASRDSSEGTVRLVAPAGWGVEPKEKSFKLAKVADRERVTFAVTAPKEPGRGELVAEATVGGKVYRSGRQEIRYPHIPPQLLQPVAKARAVCLDLVTKGKRVGYLPGAGDSVAECIGQMGYEVVELSGADLTTEKLKGLDAVVVGVRALNVRRDLRERWPALFDYAKGGGNVIVQYNRQGDMRVERIAPYDLRIQNLRVTDERAKVEFLAPEHPVLNSPNKITEKDFEGWVQERGIYYPGQWGSEFTPILAAGDKGEEPLKGGLLVAKHGEGHFVYTGLVFFRQLPAGVPGAYRLFANLLSLGK